MPPSSPACCLCSLSMRSTSAWLLSRSASKASASSSSSLSSSPSSPICVLLWLSEKVHVPGKQTILSKSKNVAGEAAYNVNMAHQLRRGRMHAHTLSCMAKQRAHMFHAVVAIFNR